MITVSVQNKCPVCGDFPGRTWGKVIKYACPSCQTEVSVREDDFPRGGGVNVVCPSCKSILHLPDHIWCPQCRKGLVGLDQILQYIAEENGVSVEVLTRQGNPPKPSVADLLRFNEQFNHLGFFGTSSSESLPASATPASFSPMPVQEAAPAVEGPSVLVKTAPKATVRITRVVFGLIALAVLIAIFVMVPRSRSVTKPIIGSWVGTATDESRNAAFLFSFRVTQDDKIPAITWMFSNGAVISFVETPITDNSFAARAVIDGDELLLEGKFDSPTTAKGTYSSGRWSDGAWTATVAPTTEGPTVTEAALVETIPTEAPTEVAVLPTGHAIAKLVVWVDDQRAPLLLELGKEFQVDTGVVLEVMQKQFRTIRDELLVAGPAGEGPDILIGMHDWLGELVASGLVAEVDLGPNAGEFTDESVAAFTYNGKLYGMPYAVENVALIYNPEAVTEAPATWGDVKVLSQAGIDAGAKYGLIIQENDPYRFYPIQTAFGGYVFGKNADGSWNPQDVGINSAGTISAATWLDSMYVDGLLDRTAMVNVESMRAAFINGDASMMIDGPWVLNDLREAGVPYVIANLPAGAQPAKPFLDVQGFLVSAFSQQAPLAQSFLQQYVATPEMMKAISDLNLRPSAFKSVNAAIEDSDIKAFAAAGAGSDAMPNIPQMSAVWWAWGNAIQSVSMGQQTPAVAMNSAQEQILTTIGQ